MSIEALSIEVKETNQVTTNAPDHGGRPQEPTVQQDPAEPSRASHGSLDRDWEALARKLAIEPTERDPNAGYGQCGKIPQTNEDFVFAIRVILESCCPWLQVHKGEPTHADCYLFSITFTSDEQDDVREADSTDHPETTRPVSVGGCQ